MKQELRSSREPSHRERGGESSFHNSNTKVIEGLTIREYLDKRRVERPSTSINGRIQFTQPISLRRIKK
jgi:hypothetical protein